MRKQCKRKIYHAAPSIAFIRGKTEVGDGRALAFWVKTEYAWSEIRLGQDVYADNPHYKHTAMVLIAAAYCLEDPLLRKNKTLDGIRALTLKAGHCLSEASKRAVKRFDANNKETVRYSFKADEHATICRFFEGFEAVHAMLPYDAWHIGWCMAAKTLGFEEMLDSKLFTH